MTPTDDDDSSRIIQELKTRTSTGDDIIPAELLGVVGIYAGYPSRILINKSHNIGSFLEQMNSPSYIISHAINFS